MLRLTLILFALLWSLSVAAQSPLPYSYGIQTPTPTATPLSVPIPSVEGDPLAALSPLLSMQLGLAESGFKLNSDERSRTRLLSFYERAVEERCMGALLTSVVYQGNPTDQYCLYFIAKALSISADSPASICAQNGIDAPSCIAAYKSETVAPYLYEMTSYGAIDSSQDDERASAKLFESTNQMRLLETRARITDAINEHRSNPTPETQAKLEALFEQSLQLSCKFTSLSLSKSYIQPKATRTRMVQSQCLEQTSFIQQLSPNFPPAVCAHSGYYTPACTRARRIKFQQTMQRRLPQNAPRQAPNTPNNNLAVF